LIKQVQTTSAPLANATAHISAPAGRVVVEEREEKEKRSLGDKIKDALGLGHKEENQ